MGAPEAHEGAVAKSKENDIRGPDAESPEAVAPHLGDPLPVLHAVQYLKWDAPRGTRSQVVADRGLLGSGEQGAKGRVFQLRLHPLVARHHRDATKIVQAFDRFRGDASGL